MYFAWYSRVTVGQNFAKFVKWEGEQNLLSFKYRHVLIVRFCQNRDFEKFSSQCEGLSAEISKDEALRWWYLQFLHKLKDVQNNYLESKLITEFQSFCDDMSLQQFRSILPSEVGFFVDQRIASSATEMAKLADLFYESNRDGNAKIDAWGNFKSRGNQPFKPKNFSMPNVNSESSKKWRRYSAWGQEARVGGTEAGGFPNSVLSLQNAKSQKIWMFQTAAKVKQLCKSLAIKSTDYRQSVCYSVVCKRQVGWWV